jgi:hypothetical protein
MLVENGTCGPIIFRVSGLGQSFCAPVFKIVGIGFHFIFRQVQDPRLFFDSDSSLTNRNRINPNISDSDWSKNCRNRKTAWDPGPVGK